VLTPSRRAVPAVLAAGTLLALAGCPRWGCVRSDGRQQLAASKGEKVSATDREFAAVELNSLEPNACSPRPPDDAFRGVLIRAPSRVTFKESERVGRFGAFAAIPICGYYQLELAALPPCDDVVQAMRLVAVDVATGEEHSGHMVDADPGEPPPIEEPPPTAEELEGLSVGGYFNPNLADFVPLPERAAVYDVFVELGEFRSNTARIEVVEQR
jgi:hypothetical protein